MNKDLDLIEKEKLKYNDLHRLSGYQEDQLGYGRQLELLKNSNSPFFVDIRNSIKNDKVLEIGVGAGEITRWLIENVKDTYSIDISDYASESLRHILNTERVLQMSAHSLKFENNTFNVVLHLDGMEHIPENLEEDCLSEATRVLISGGKIYYANACTDSWWDHKLEKLGHNAAHVNIKTPDQWFKFYESRSKKFSYEVYHYENHGETVYFVLEKK